MWRGAAGGLAHGEPVGLAAAAGGPAGRWAITTAAAADMRHVLAGTVRWRRCWRATL